MIKKEKILAGGAKQEMAAPEGVMLADERVMTAAVFELDLDCEDGECRPCAGHKDNTTRILGCP